MSYIGSYTYSLIVVLSDWKSLLAKRDHPNERRRIECHPAFEHAVQTGQADHVPS